MNPRRIPNASNPLVALLDKLAQERGWTREGLSKRAGLSKEAIRGIENRGPGATVNMKTIQGLAKALEIDPNVLIDAMPSRELLAQSKSATSVPSPAAVATLLSSDLPRDLPILGTAAGSAIGAFQISTDAVGYARRPPMLFGVPDAYCLYVENDSMAPKYQAGDLLIVNPHRPLAIGDAMVIQVQLHKNADPQSFVKTYKGRTAEWIVAEQYNPAGEVRYKRETVLRMHRVLTMNEILGL